MTDVIFNGDNKLRQVKRDVQGNFGTNFLRCAKSGLQVTWNVVLTGGGVGGLIEPERH